MQIRIIMFHLLTMALGITVLTIKGYEEKSIVVVIPSYNNSAWYRWNLDSVLKQQYTNFRVIYTDDCSSDGTAAFVHAYLAEYDHDKRVTLVKNTKRVGALHNLYAMIHSCNDYDIIVTVDGDDAFPDEYVLQRLNDAYSSREIWLTYGQFKMYSTDQVGWAIEMPDYIVKNNAFRYFQHLPTHLRTFYAWLFKKIRLEDLLYLGNFYPMTWDMAMMFPMIEMAGERHAFIPDIMYVYNDLNSISDHRVSRQLQAHLAQIVKSKRRYERLAQEPIMQTNDTQMADIIIFSHRSAEQLEQCICSLYKYVQGFDTISILYYIPQESKKKDFDELQLKYPFLSFHCIDEHRSNFRDLFMSVYRGARHDFILFSKGDACFKYPVDLRKCCKALEDTQAYAFYFKLDAHNGIKADDHVPFIPLNNAIVAWNFSVARDKWSCANSLDVVLHRKTDSLYSIMQDYFEPTPEGFETVWANEGKLNRIGLCFQEDCIEQSNEKKVQ